MALKMYYTVSRGVSQCVFPENCTYYSRLVFQTEGSGEIMNGFTIGLAAGMAAGAWVGMRVQANRRQVKSTIRTAARRAEDAFDSMTR